MCCSTFVQQHDFSFLSNELVLDSQIPGDYSSLPSNRVAFLAGHLVNAFMDGLFSKKRSGMFDGGSNNRQRTG